MHEAHYPGRAAIDFYGDGGFRFADMSHKGSILCLPGGIYAWKVNRLEDLIASDLEQIIREAEAIEILLIGTGIDMRPLPFEVKAILRDNAIGVDAMSTGAAVRTFNVLLAEKRAVAAAFIAVE